MLRIVTRAPVAAAVCNKEFLQSSSSPATYVFAGAVAAVVVVVVVEMVPFAGELQAPAPATQKVRTSPVFHSP